MTFKKIGDASVYWPLPCLTGTSSAQPRGAEGSGPGVRMEACCHYFPPEFILFDDRGSLDAPDRIPCGSVRAQDFEPASAGRLLISHVYRDGTWRTS